MSQILPTYDSSSESSIKLLRAMVGIGIICALMIALTFEGTLPRIEKNKAEALEKAIFRVIPDIKTKKTFELDQHGNFIEVNSKEQEGQLVYAGYDENNQLVGFAIPASGIGFADVLRILYGYDPINQTIVGFHVLESKETPGLGDKIEKDPAFLANFDALDVSLIDDYSMIRNKVVPVKHGTKKNPWEIDAITGATISSRAIGNILAESTQYWVPLIYKNKEIFKMDN